MTALLILLLAKNRQEAIDQHLTPEQQYLALGVGVVVVLAILLFLYIARNSA